MNDPLPEENSSHNLMTQIPKFIIPSSGAIGMFTFGPWQTLAVGSCLLIIRGITWSLTNPEDFWDKVESHLHRGKKAYSKANRSRRNKKSTKASSEKQPN